MTESDILDFVRSSFRSVWNVELLLFLSRSPSRAWAAEELVREMRSSDIVVNEGLTMLQAAGLVSPDGSGFRYAPANPQLHGYVTELDTLYRERPLTVIKAIFSQPSDKLQTFADAFRLKKD